MFKILHFADLHLDASFSRVGMTSSVAKQRREELRSSLKCILNKALELGVDTITIAGDLYEHDRVSPDTMNFVKKEFEAIAPIPVVITPGNHDPFLPGSPYRQIEWSPNVFIFSASELSPHTLTSGITIWGVAHNSPSFRVNVLERFKVTGDGVHILLLHASDTSCVPSGKEAHCPFTPEQITRAGVNFALLGHYHKATLSPKDKPLYGYPGDPEPLGFDEEGLHHVFLVEIEDNEVTVQMIPINAVDYRTIETDVSEALSIEDIKRSIRKKGDEDHLGTCFVRVILKGALSPDVDLDLEAILRDCHESFRFMDIDNRSYPAYDLETIKDESTVRGAFVSKMLRYLDDCSTSEDKYVAQRALLYGLRALDGREIEPV